MEDIRVERIEATPVVDPPRAGTEEPTEKDYTWFRQKIPSESRRTLQAIPWEVLALQDELSTSRNLARRRRPRIPRS